MVNILVSVKKIVFLFNFARFGFHSSVLIILDGKEPGLEKLYRDFNSCLVCN